jgi:hypothetical protein
VTRRAGNAILQLRWDVGPDREREFNRWYDEEHLGDVVAVPGVFGGRRFERVPGAAYVKETPWRYLTVYELAGADALARDEFVRLGTEPSEWTRAVAFDLPMDRAVLSLHGATPADAAAAVPVGSAILHVTMDVRPDRFDDFLAWHADDHLPAVASAPGVLAGRRLVDTSTTTGDLRRVVAIYELADESVATSDAFFEAGRPTPWREKLGDSFTSDPQVYRQINATDE